MKGLSIIIITYNRKEEVIFTLKSLEEQCYSGNLEIIVVDQNSTDGTEKEVSNIKNNKIKYIKLDKNFGVAGGRNIGVKHATFENMIFLDDDAHFVSKMALSNIEDIMNTTSNKIYAFQIRDLKDGLFHWPYKKKMISKCKERFLCNKYIGCGHAIKKSFFESVGGYSDNLFFGFEETELVMKLFGANEKPVLYDGSIEIIHRVTPTTRIIESKRFYYKVRNRLYVIREMHPIGGGLYFLYYIIGYLYRAFRLGLISEYKNAVKNILGYKICKNNRMTYKSFIRYIYKYNC